MRNLAAALIRASGFLHITREILLKKKVTILIYHDPEPDIFESHMRYLSKFYNFLPLSQLVDAVSNQDWSHIPRKALVLTFDDGVMGNYRLLKIFKEHNIRPSIYLCSHIVDTNRKFWVKSGFTNHESLKKVENKHRLQVLKSEAGFEQEKEYGERQSLNNEEIQEMAPDVDFQCHSKFHPILTNCTDEECRDEVEESKKHLEALLNTSIDHFCYPNGDYADREERFVQQAGFLSARTVDVGWNDVHSHPFRLKGMYVDDDASLNVLNAQVSGVFGYLRYLRFGSFNGKHPPYI